MYNDHNQHHSTIDVNMFVPGLSVYENYAEGLIRLVSRVCGGVGRLFTLLSRGW